DRRGISELLGDAPHYRGDRPLRRAVLALRPFGEGDRSEQRPAPCAEVLRGELGAQMLLHVLVKALARQVVELAVAPVAEDARTGNLEQLVQRGGELLVDDRPAHLDLLLAGEGERDPVAVHGEMPFCERRNAVSVRAL